ncbi:hypothetical protein QSH57_004242 [Fusarium oxysporum f. sp. vasinfectum]|nr:hypothetical protein QSH57_004242 [Fusarium oxysporum f. sp. vasinfectum]
MRKREEFCKVSMRWHYFFDFGAEDRTDQFGSILGGLKRKKEAFDDEREMMRRKRFDRLHRIDIKGQLRQMMGPTAMFRGLQEKVIRAVARGEWPIVQVTPTGGRQEFDVYVAGILYAGWGNRGDHAVGIVAGRHGRTMSEVGD